MNHPAAAARTITAAAPARSRPENRRRGAPALAGTREVKRTDSGGRRLLYRIPPGVIVPKRRFDREGSHVIILGEGSYTVMPPSVHASGEVYSCG